MSNCGQNTMEPIKDLDMIKDISDFLSVSSKKHGKRNQLLWIMGVYFGLRVNRLVELKVRDVRNNDIVYLRENKRSKERKLLINKELRKMVDDYVINKADYEYLFASQKGGKPISRQQAWRILKSAAKTFGISNMGTHTLRKTYGYIIYIQSGKDPVAVKEALNVGSIEVALRYIGVVRDQSLDIMSRMKLL